jgi:hypothetical protein
MVKLRNQCLQQYKQRRVRHSSLVYAHLTEEDGAKRIEIQPQPQPQPSHEQHQHISISRKLAPHLHVGVHHQAALRQVGQALRQGQPFQQDAAVQLVRSRQVALKPRKGLDLALEQHHPRLGLRDQRSGARAQGGVELLDILTAVGIGGGRVQLFHLQGCVREDELA